MKIILKRITSLLTLRRALGRVYRGLSLPGRLGTTGHSEQSHIVYYTAVHRSPCNTVTTHRQGQDGSYTQTLLTGVQYAFPSSSQDASLPTAHVVTFVRPHLTTPILVCKTKVSYTSYKHYKGYLLLIQYMHLHLPTSIRRWHMKIIP